jgi:hypothetical protein
MLAKLGLGVNVGSNSNKGVKKAKDHYKGFKEAISDVKYNYLFLVFFNLDLVKHVSNIKLSIELGYTKLKKRFF